MIKSVREQETIEAMRRFGGTFVASLGETMARADLMNLDKLKAAFSQEWAHYGRMAESLKSKQEAEK
jgi:hypothetical protein